MLIELFRQLSLLKRYERIFVEVVVFERGWVTLSANLRGMGGRPLTTEICPVIKIAAIKPNCVENAYNSFETVVVV